MRVQVGRAKQWPNGTDEGSSGLGQTMAKWEGREFRPTDGQRILVVNVLNGWISKCMPSKLEFCYSGGLVKGSVVQSSSWT